MRVRRQRMGESSVRRRTALLKKEPAIGDGCQSREVTLGSVSRFAGALCVAIHTRTGKILRTALRVR